ncbi:hypothetical protein CapIbe_023710 [Capra ibex]
MESEVLFPLCHVENSRPLREVYVEIVVEDKQLFTADSHHRSAPTGLPSPTSWNCIPWLGEEQMVNRMSHQLLNLPLAEASESGVAEASESRANRTLP